MNTVSTNTATTIRVGAVLFEDFELLDFFGPLEMFGLLGDGVAITVVAEKTGAVKSSAGPCAVAEALISDSDGFDVLLIPGGIGTRKAMTNPQFLGELIRLADASSLVATVCTGSFLLGKTGLLDHRDATTNKRVFSEAANYAPKVNWIAKARWVQDGKYFTSSGISAGIDMSLAVIAKLRGWDVSLRIAERAEYYWQEDASCDPFAYAAGL